jgi:UDP-N-acetylglucosamine:LPS N-acetylglucosamine transferase
MSNGRKVLAVASAGGHWVQLRRLQPAFEGHDIAYVTTNAGYRDEVNPARFYAVNDASRWNKIALARMALRIVWIVLRERPDAVVSTGAACGYFAIRAARLLGSRTIWLDSIANIDEISMSGQLVRRYADVWLTQWPHLATDGGPRYEGAVL